MVSACFLATLVATLAGASAAVIDALTFSAPFDDVNGAGDRIIGKYWRATGSATIHNNFVRLTPDRQSKKGGLWSTRSVSAKEVSASLKFRISGQGKKYFGDGMALWLTDSRAYKQGDFHGSSPGFKGIGVILDTFKNSETLNYHKDVTLVWNDGGEQDAEKILEASVGCNGDFRYHEDRGDFSILSSARVRVVVEPKWAIESGESSGGAAAEKDGGGGATSSNTLVARVFLDASNAGEYATCVAEADLPPVLNAAWLAKAHLGVTASTGQLADNHDVLGLEVFSDSEAHDEAEALPDAKYFEPGQGVTPERFERIEAQLDTLVAKLEQLQHHLEHEMVAVDDHVRTTIDKLQKQEQGAEARIDLLEEKVVNNVEDSLASRISTLEDAMRDAVQKRVKAVEHKYMSSLHSVVGDKIATAGRGWTLPFLFLIAVDLAAAFAVYKWYIKFKKSHLL